MSSSTTSSDARRFRRVFLGLLTFGALSIAAADILADPFDLGFEASSERLSPHREHGSRTAKAAIPWRLGCGALLMGTSRTEAGFKSDGILSGKNPVNLALSMTNVVELEYVLNHALEWCNPSTIIMESSFLMFGGTRTTSQDFTQSPFNPELDATEFWLASILGRRAIRQSIEVVRKLVRGELSSVDTRGFLAKRVRTSSKQATERVLKSFFTNPKTYYDFTLSQARLVSFERMLSSAQFRGVAIEVFIPPMHALQLEAIRVAGLWDQFEAWKESMAQIGDRTGVPIHDFADGSAILAEPLSESLDAPTKWFFESSHFKPVLGEKVLARIVLDRPDPELPGSLLTVDSARSNLDALRARQRLYASSHPSETKWVQELYSEAMAEKVNGR